MLNRYARALFSKILLPVARLLVRLGISPDVVTLVGTLGVCVGALAFFPQGQLFWGTMFVTAFVFSDMIDGAMARMLDRPSRWGAYLDSTLDRFGDAAVFGGLLLNFTWHDDDRLLAGLSLWCLVFGAIVSYAKARAEGLGMTANVGIAERADRLVLILVAAGLSGLGVPYALAAALWILAVASVVTVVQRMLVVRRQALA